MNGSPSISRVGLAAAVALSALCAPATSQFGYHKETLGVSGKMREVLEASASHDAWERGRLTADIDYLGSSARAYELLVNAAGGSFPFAAYSVQVSPSTSASGFLLGGARRVVSPISAKLFPSDVTKTFLLTTGSYTLSGNVLNTASLDLTFTPPNWSDPRWRIAGKMSGKAVGTLRLLSPLASVLDYAADFGEQSFDGDFSIGFSRWPSLNYQRSAVDLKIRVAPPTLIGTTPAYKTLQATKVDPLFLSPFILLSL